MGLISPADLVCPRHLREAAENDVSGLWFGLNLAVRFNRTMDGRGDDPGDAAFWARPLCETLDSEDVDWAWRKAAVPPSPREKLRAPVPTTPISKEAMP